jgi:hypothetical protein
LRIISGLPVIQPELRLANHVSANAITNAYSAWREPQQNSVSRLGIISDSESRGPRDR